jgi:hypothetical protein
MRTCPWCGYQNLNVYAYCQRCGRGFDGPEHKDERPRKRRLWPFGSRSE